MSSLFIICGFLTHQWIKTQGSGESLIRDNELATARKLHINIAENYPKIHHGDLTTSETLLVTGTRSSATSTLTFRHEIGTRPSATSTPTLPIWCLNICNYHDIINRQSVHICGCYNMHGNHNLYVCVFSLIIAM